MFIQQDKICPINQITQYYLKDTVELPFKQWVESLHEGSITHKDKKFQPY
jgi:hypothetical protein